MPYALALNCTLKPSPSPSSTEVLTGQVLGALARFGVDGKELRVVDYEVRPGVETDMGDGDQWPDIRDQILAADIVLVCTPIWMGHMSSIAQRVLERLDAELSQTDDKGRAVLAGKVAATVVVGRPRRGGECDGDARPQRRASGKDVERASLPRSLA